LPEPLTLLLAGRPPSCDVVDEFGHLPFSAGEGCHQVDHLTRVEHGSPGTPRPPSAPHSPASSRTRRAIPSSGAARSVPRSCAHTDGSAPTVPSASGDP